MKNRLLGLDLLRAVAVILVMFRHYNISETMKQGSWIGVDLFFVLSGFLVSGLLFREYQQSGTIRAKRFLIRRAFKIYPAFWLVLLLHIVYLTYKGFPVYGNRVLADLLFVQNFFRSIMGISWTLAVEEHFYFLLACFASGAAGRKWIDRKGVLVPVCVSVLAGCLALRVLLRVLYPHFDYWIHFFPTYVRLDTLVFGVLLSWFYHFRKEAYTSFLRKHKGWLLLLLVPGLVWPFLFDFSSFAANTVGLTVLYLSCGVLVGFAADLRVPSWKALLLLGRIGTFSYSIYLVHMIFGPGVANFFKQHLLPGAPPFFYALVYFLSNILLGVAISLTVERVSLRLREKHFPSGVPAV